MVKKETIEELVKLQGWIDRDRRQYELDAWMRLKWGRAAEDIIFHQ
jgi:hypothetical protein